MANLYTFLFLFAIMNEACRAVATIGAWGAIATPPIFIAPPHQTFGKLKFTIENFNNLIVIN